MVDTLKMQSKVVSFNVSAHHGSMMDAVDKFCKTAQVSGLRLPKQVAFPNLMAEQIAAEMPHRVLMLSIAQQRLLEN
jgi:hypothetical protein